MGGMCSSLQKALLDHTLGIAPFPADASLYLSLHFADPTDVGSYADEVPTLGTGYARQLITGKMGATDSSSGISVNSSTITFPVLTADYGRPVTFIGIGTALSGGTMRFSGPLQQSQLKFLGQSVQFAPGQLSIKYD